MKQSVQLWFKRYYDMMWELRPWWFNAFIATPLALAVLAFLPIGYFLCPPYRRFIVGMCAALDDDYEHIHEQHKLES